MKTIDEEMKTSSFEEVAKANSELPGGEILLGEFKQGELDSTLEEAALKLKKDEVSGWIETDTGWYILQLVKREDPQLVEYKNVRADIENKLRMEEQNKKLDEYIEELKKESYIKIYKDF
jgi:foldase protein PrsA